METPCFSIGRAIKKKPIKKKIKKNQISLPYYTTSLFSFKIYKGPRWHIPESTSLSNSVKFKFSLLETVFSLRELKIRISENMQNIKFKFIKSSENLHLSSYYEKQELEWNKVRSIYFRLFKLRKLLLPLILRWLIKKSLKNCKNTEDPVTLEIPKNPVTIIDFKKRISFIYEASTLKKTIENRLLVSDYMFPEPSQPVNLLTNEPFTYQQLISITNQCKKYGYVSTIVDSFKELNGNIELFSFHNKQKLKVEAIKTFFKKPTMNIKEVVLDYFKLEADYTELPDAQTSRFINAYDTNPEMPIIQKWIGITRDYYIAKELCEPILLRRISDKIDNFFNVVYKIFLY